MERGKQIMDNDDNIRLLESITVPELDTPIRISDFFSPDIFRVISSRKAVKKAVKSGLVTIDGKQAITADFIKGGEQVEVFQKLEDVSSKQIDIKLEVLYEDDYLAIINKPAGIVVSGNKKWTLENALTPNIKASIQTDALPNPEPIHRLDYPTTGALMVGKTSKAVILLNQLFEARKVDKTYMAATVGKMQNSGKVESDIDGKPSLTEYHVLHTLESDRYDYINLVELNPHTGRRHQLRRHMSEIGNPIFGDLEYGIEGKILKGKGVYLHAYRLQFEHPFTKENIEIKAPWPQKFVYLFREILDS